MHVSRSIFQVRSEMEALVIKIDQKYIKKPEVTIQNRG